MIGRRFLSAVAMLALLAGTACGQQGGGGGGETPAQTPAATPATAAGTPAPGGEPGGPPPPPDVTPPATPGGALTPGAEGPRELVVNIETAGINPDVLRPGQSTEIDLVVKNTTAEARTVTVTGPKDFKQEVGKVEPGAEAKAHLKLGEPGEYEMTAVAEGGSTLTSKIEIEGAGGPPAQGGSPAPGGSPAADGAAPAPGTTAAPAAGATPPAGQ